MKKVDKLKKFIINLGYKVENESGKVDTNAVYVLFGLSLVYGACSLVNFFIDCRSGIGANIIAGYLINISLFIRNLTYEYVQVVNIINNMSPQDVTGSEEFLVPAPKAKKEIYCKIALISMLVVLAASILFEVKITNRVLWVFVWMHRGMCLSTVFICVFQHFVIMLEQKYKAHMVPFKRIEEERRAV